MAAKNWKAVADRLEVELKYLEKRYNDGFLAPIDYKSARLKVERDLMDAKRKAGIG